MRSALSPAAALAGFIAAATCAPCLPACHPSTPTEARTATLLYTHDVAGDIEPCG